MPNRAGEGGTREARRKQAVSCTTHVAAGAVAGQRFIAPVSHLHEAASQSGPSQANRRQNTKHAYNASSRAQGRRAPMQTGVFGVID